MPTLHKYISQFLEQVCQQIKYKRIHKDISQELQGHIGELRDSYIEDGMDEGEAIEKAVEQMGDPINIGKNLNKTHRPKTEWSIIALIGIIVLIGGIAIFSIASDELSMVSMTGFARHTSHILLGLAICTFFYFFDYTKLEKYSLHIFIGSIVFLLLSIRFGIEFNGIPYVGLGNFTFTATSITLPLFLISFSGLANKWVTGNKRDILKLFGLASLAMILSLIEPSFAATILLGVGFLIITTIAIMGKNFNGNRKNFLLSIYGFISIFSLVTLINIIWRKPYIKARLLIFLKPSLDPNGAGYIHGILAKLLSTAKMFGKNDNLYLIFEGSKMLALPEANTAFIFTYIVSAFGWIMGIATILIITLAVGRMFLATKQINDQYGRYLANSITVTFALQALANILMNLGLFPITGFSLPFISYGGSNFIMNMALIGLLLGVYRRKDLIATRYRCL